MPDVAQAGGAWSPAYGGDPRAGDRDDRDQGG